VITTSVKSSFEYKKEAVPSFFSQLMIVPDSMVGESAGNATRLCSGRELVA